MNTLKVSPSRLPETQELTDLSNTQPPALSWKSKTYRELSWKVKVKVMYSLPGIYASVYRFSCVVFRPQRAPLAPIWPLRAPT